jgi:hypothetical protein
MASAIQIATPDAIRRIRRVQTVTIVWMTVEALVSLFAAWRASSPALLAFGGDSAIELFSAVVVLWRFRASAAHSYAERRAARVAGILLFALAAYVAVISVASLLGYSEPKPTLLGIAIFGRSRRRYAVACEREAATVRSYKQCGVEGGRRPVSAVCLSVTDCIGRTGGQRHLARQVGRPACGSSRSASDRLGRSRSHAW